MDELEEFEFRHRLEKEQAQPRQPAKIGAEGFGEAFTKEFQSRPGWERGLAAAASFPRQIYEGAKQIFGREDKPAIEATRIMEKEEPVSAVLGGASSMVPLSMVPGINTIAGSAATGAATGALTPTMGDESRGENALVGGAVGGATQGVLKAAGIPLSKLWQVASDKAASLTSQNSVRTATIKEAQAAGYVLPPTVTGGGLAAKAVESAGGKASIAQEASIRNQQVTNTIARREASLAADEPITEGNLAKARDVLAEPYREIAAISPRAKQALEKLQEARLDSKDAWRKYGGPTGGPEERRAALAADQKVAVLERLIDKEATASGRPDLLPALKDARVKIAKNYDVEAALNIGDGNIEASVIGRILDRRGEKAVTGGLQTVGKFAQAFQSFAREKPTGQSAPGVNYLKPYLAGAMGMSGYQASEHYGFGPWGAAAATLPMISGPARSIALSRLMQGAPQYGPGMALSVANQTAKSPLLPLGAIPLANIANQ